LALSKMKCYNTKKYDRKYFFHNAYFKLRNAK
jgi:hypothetical protein